MAFQFSDGQKWQPGNLLLGHSFLHGDTGIATDRHAITVAGSRSGKGAALIIPNLLRWPENALVIDPKGENAEHTWEAREALGQSVHVLDPFRCSAVPDRLRAAFNPFDLLDPDALTIREDVNIIADALVLRSNDRDALWDNGAVSVLAGLIAHILTAAPAADRHLLTVRGVFKLPAEARAALLDDMQRNPACGGLAQAAATIGLSESKKNAEFWDGARHATDWLDSIPMRDTLTRSSFDLADLKTGKATVYLVLPPAYIGEHGRFLRLFVKLALNAMSKGQGGSRCLFLLDEFFALGRLSEVSRAAGLLPSYGVHLWPFLQNLGQLIELYGREGAETFFGNADAHIFFGNSDAETLDHISRRLGVVTSAEIDAPPALSAAQASGVQLSTPFFGFGSPDQERAMMAHHQKTIHLTGVADANTRAWVEAENRNAMNRYQHDMARVGKPRLAPDEVRELIAKKDGDTVARWLIAFTKGREVCKLRLLPYFLDGPYIDRDELARRAAYQRQWEIDTARKNADADWVMKRDRIDLIVWVVVLLMAAVIAAYVLWKLSQPA